jgi:ribA/ribD-fused uncharacterized protein
MKITDQFVLFYGGVFSQWYRSDILIDGVIYNCAEQYMMAMKAKCFNDADAHRKIMILKDPQQQKAMGRQIQNFDADKWNAIAKDVVYKANLAKFSGELRHHLMDTGEREIVEASPYDKIWGIGLGENDPRALDKSQWQGTNWLGECLMQVRETFQNERSQAW